MRIKLFLFLFRVTGEIHSSYCRELKTTTLTYCTHDTELVTYKHFPTSPGITIKANGTAQPVSELSECWHTLARHYHLFIIFARLVHQPNHPPMQPPPLLPSSSRINITLRAVAAADAAVDSTADDDDDGDHDDDDGRWGNGKRTDKNASVHDPAHKVYCRRTPKVHSAMTSSRRFVSPLHSRRRRRRRRQ